MASKLAQRIFQAHLELSYRYGRRVTLAEFGKLIAKEMRRGVPFTSAAVSRWENGLQIPSLAVIEAIAGVTGVDPGWISHGEKTAAAGPVRKLPSAQTPGTPHRTVEKPSLPAHAPTPAREGRPPRPRPR